LHPDLSFVLQCKEKINKAYAMLGIIRRNFIYLSLRGSFCFNIQGSCQITTGYANSVWNPYRMGLIKDLEKVQMRATKLLITIKHLKYKDRLKERLKLPISRFRIIRGDMIEMYKILTCRYCKNVNLHSELHQDNITRGHSLKLVNSRCRQDLSKFSFSARIVNIRSSLLASVISANNVNTFKNRLDMFSTNQELIYNYKSTLTGIGNRSSVNTFDDTIFC